MRHPILLMIGLVATASSCATIFGDFAFQGTDAAGTGGAGTGGTPTTATGGAGNAPTCKSEPTYVWAKSFGDAPDQNATALAVDGSGNILVTGALEGIVDFGTGPLANVPVPSPYLGVLDSSGNGRPYSGVFPITGMASTATAVVSDKLGDALLVGAFNGSMKLDNSTMLAATSYASIFLARVQTGGSASGQAYGNQVGMSYQAPTSIAVDSSGNVVMAGFLRGADFGCGSSSATNGLFIVKLDPQNNCLWSHGFGAYQSVTTPSVALDAVGNVVIAGGYTNPPSSPVPATIDFGNGHTISTAAAKAQAIFVAKLDAAMGLGMWAKSFGDVAGGGSASRVAVDGNGAVVLAGSLNGSVDFGGGPRSASGASALFLTKLDNASGAHVWSKAFGSVEVTAATNAKGLAVDTAGNVTLAGEFDGLMDFGCSPLNSKGDTDVFAARFDAMGNPLWSQQWGDDQKQTSAGIALAPGGAVVLAGSFAGQMDFGGGTPLNSAGGTDIFVAKLQAP